VPVALDPAGAERIKKASPPPKAFQLEDEATQASCSANGQQGEGNRILLPPAYTRAVLVTKLLQLMNGRSGVRLQVAEYIAALLNTGCSLPLLAWSETDGQQGGGALPQLAQACYGLGEISTSAGLEPPKLSPSERLVLQGGAAASAGVSCLLVQGGKKLLSMAKAGAALSIEAVGMQVRRVRGTCICTCTYARM
jgi:histidine ammonia-lyase